MALDLRRLDPEARRILTGVWSTLATLALVVGVLSFLFPSFRHQLALSASRQSAPYVELFAQPLDPEDFGTTCAPDARGRTTVVFGLTSHLHDTEQIPYRVTVTADPDHRAQRVSRVESQLLVSPGATRTTSVKVGLPHPPTASSITVALVGTGQELLLHCGTPS